MEVNIAKVAPDQIPALLKLLRELARFEHREREVTATNASLRRALFRAGPGGREPAAS